MNSTKRLRKHHWDQIEDHASAHFLVDLGYNNEGEREDIASASVEEYSQIDIDW